MSAATLGFLSTMRLLSLRTQPGSTTLVASCRLPPATSLTNFDRYPCSGRSASRTIGRSDGVGHDILVVRLPVLRDRARRDRSIRRASAAEAHATSGPGGRVTAQGEAIPPCRFDVTCRSMLEHADPLRRHRGRRETGNRRDRDCWSAGCAPRTIRAASRTRRAVVQETVTLPAQDRLWHDDVPERLGRALQPEANERSSTRIPTLAAAPVGTGSGTLAAGRPVIRPRRVDGISHMPTTPRDQATGNPPISRSGRSVPAPTA